MLRTRQNYVEMDAVKANSSQFGGLPALTAAHVAALASVSIDASRIPASDAITMADVIIAQNAALAAAGDPSKSGAENWKTGAAKRKGGKGKEGKSKSKMPKGKGKGNGGKGGADSSQQEFVIPRDENGKVTGWVVGMSPCWCKNAGLDDGKHIFDHCKYDENGKLKTSKVAGVASVAPSSSADSSQQIAAIAAAAKKFMESQASSDSTSETLHAKSAVVTPPEDINDIMNDAAITEELNRFWAMSTEQQATATKVKTFISNTITIFLWSLVAITIVAAIVAGLHWAACAVPGHSSLAQMNAAHLEVPISHYDAFPWISWLFLKATENVALVRQYSNLWWSYIICFFKVNARIAMTFLLIYFLRRDIIGAISYVTDVAHSAIRPLRARSSRKTREERSSYIQSTAHSLTRLSHSFPRTIGLIILLSGLIPGAVGHPSSPTHGFCTQVNIAGIQHVDLPARGANYNPFDAVAISQQVDKIDEPSMQTALLREQMASLANSAAPESKPLPKSISSLPLFHAALDSGCTGSCTGYLDRLVNVRPCKEVYAQANGRLSYCHWKGDMPVFVKTGTNTIVSINITNVRYVPDFKYTLLSVKQLWREQHIDARFRDLNHLELPSGGITVPYDGKSDLPIITVSSAVSVFNRAGRNTPLHKALIGFHSTKSVSHIAKLSSSQAGQLMHRRGHGSIAKIRASVHTSADAPSNLASAPPTSCVHCASAQMRRTAHSGHLHVPPPEPGDLHVDLKEMKNISLFGGYRYAAFFIDEHSRFVMVEFLKHKAEVIDATKRAMAKFDALVGVPIGEDGKPLARPKVRRLHRDHEGQLESAVFEKFRAEASLHSTTSPPHDHNLNPIAESTIRTIDT